MTSSLIIAVFDGHGQFGHDVSKFCKVYFESRLVTHPYFSSDVRKAIIETTASLERDMLASPKIDTIFSGSTMSLVVLRGTNVIVANLGDSRVILGHCRGSSLNRTNSLSPGTTPEDANSIGSGSSTGSYQKLMIYLFYNLLSSFNFIF